MKIKRTYKLTEQAKRLANAGAKASGMTEKEFLSKILDLCEVSQKKE